MGVSDNMENTLSQKKQQHNGDKRYFSIYSVNWEEIYQAAQNTLCENIIEQTANLGTYHTRVLRILKTKGYLNETDIGQMSLLPPRDTRAVLNTLMKLGYVNDVHVPLSANSKPGTLTTGPTQFMYGTDFKQVRKILSVKVLQAIVNLTMRYGELGRVLQITRDFNTLYF